MHDPGTKQSLCDKHLQQSGAILVHAGLIFCIGHGVAANVMWVTAGPQNLCAPRAYVVA
jgi:hypothetical protein